MAFRRTFSQMVWLSRQGGGWFTDQRTGEDEWKAVPVSALVGQKVNIGDKDGGVYEGVTVTGFEPAAGVLILEGGLSGSCFRPEEAAPLPAGSRLSVHDVARGFICDET